MGKTKTTVIEGAESSQMSGEAKYKARQAKKEAKQEDSVKKQVKGVGLKGGERVNAVEGGPIIEEQIQSVSTSKDKPTRARGQKIKTARSKVDRTKLYDLDEAVKLVKETSISRFDGTIELHGTVRKSDLSVQAALPHSFGESKRVEVADDKTIDKLKSGKVDFDVLLATPEMMPKLVQFAKLLGPRGLMPNPKNGTIIKDAKSASKYSADTVTIKAEKKAPLVHISVGKVSMPDKELIANIEAVLKAAGPRQFEKAFLTASMSPSVRLKVN